MIVALPLTREKSFSVHFGAAALAAVFEVDPDRHAVTTSGVFCPPERSPCSWGPWLRGLGVTRLLAGGIGEGARANLEASGVEVVVGVSAGEAETIVRSWMRGAMALRANACGHGHGHGEHDHDHDHGGACGCRH